MTGGTETEGFESESGRAPGGGWLLTDAEAAEAIRLSDQEEAERYRAHARPEEPDTDAMVSRLPKLPPQPVRLRDRLEAMLSEAAQTEAGSDDADLAAFMLSVLHAVEVAVSSRLRAERWRTP